MIMTDFNKLQENLTNAQHEFAKLADRLYPHGMVAGMPHLYCLQAEAKLKNILSDLSYIEKTLIKVESEKLQTKRNK